MLRDRKLQCVIVDDDPDTHAIIRDFLQHSNKAAVCASFLKCSDFLKKIYLLKYDIVFLDCFFPNDNISGAEVALRLKEIDKHFIFISAINELFVDACRMVGALDVMPKPLTEHRLLESIERAYRLIVGRELNLKNHILVHVQELKGETSISIHDILYAKSDEPNPRNKTVRLKHDTNYTFLHWKFSELLDLSTDFRMANKFELVSYDIVGNIYADYITLKQDENDKIPKHIPLSPTCKDSFKREFH